MKLILCGEWNLNCLQDNTQIRGVQNLLASYKLVNTIADPTRFTKNSVSLLDVMITEKLYYSCVTEVLDLGYSDHLAQILHMKVEKPKVGQRKIKSRQLLNRNIAEFNHLLKTKTWDEVFLYYDANISYDKSVNRFRYYFERAFPYKTVYIKDHIKTKWITQGIKTVKKCKKNMKICQMLY
jgi:hypothetical protein